MQDTSGKILILDWDTRGNSSGVVTLTINRPEIHNAFDDVLIAELIAALDQVEKAPNARVLVLRAVGKSFSAGADLNWMRRMADYTKEENQADAAVLAELMQKLNNLSKPTITLVQGAAMGGGVGLVACCDIAIASTKAVFSLSEVRLGLIPAVISPYVIAAIGQRATRRYFITAEQFDAMQALHLGLVHEVVEENEMEATLNNLVDHILKGASNAQAAAKALIFSVSNKVINENVIEDTVERITTTRSSDEAKEGVEAFLEKRTAKWNRMC